MMPGVAKSSCPYCHTKDVAFTAVHDFRAVDGGWRTFMKCGCCGEGVIRECVGGHPTQITGDLEKSGVLLLRQWPEPASGEAPQDVPTNVAAFFKQATDSLQAGNYDAAGMMFRKAVESATRSIDISMSTYNLYERIKKLVVSGFLTSALGEWANEVRLGGNEAAHEDALFSQGDAQALHDFTESFLTYSFTLPAAVQRRSSPGSV